MKPFKFFLFIIGFLISNAIYADCIVGFYMGMDANGNPMYKHIRCWGSSCAEVAQCMNNKCVDLPFVVASGGGTLYYNSRANSAVIKTKQEVIDFISDEVEMRLNTMIQNAIKTKVKLNMGEVQKLIKSDHGKISKARTAMISQAYHLKLIETN